MYETNSSIKSIQKTVCILVQPKSWFFRLRLCLWVMRYDVLHDVSRARHIHSNFLTKWWTLRRALETATNNEKKKQRHKKMGLIVRLVDCSLWPFWRRDVTFYFRAFHATPNGWYGWYFFSFSHDKWSKCSRCHRLQPMREEQNIEWMAQLNSVWEGHTRIFDK